MNVWYWWKKIVSYSQDFQVFTYTLKLCSSDNKKIIKKLNAFTISVARLEQWSAHWCSLLSSHVLSFHFCCHAFQFSLQLSCFSVFIGYIFEFLSSIFSMDFRLHYRPYSFSCFQNIGSAYKMLQSVLHQIGQSPARIGLSNPTSPSIQSAGPQKLSCSAITAVTSAE